MHFRAATGFVRPVFVARGLDAPKSVQQDGMQSIAALRGDRVQGEKRKHRRILQFSW